MGMELGGKLCPVQEQKGAWLDKKGIPSKVPPVCWASGHLGAGGMCLEDTRPVIWVSGYPSACEMWSESPVEGRPETWDSSTLAPNGGLGRWPISPNPDCVRWSLPPLSAGRPGFHIR